MEEINKMTPRDFKLTPRDAKLGLVCDLALPQLEVHNFNLNFPIKEEPQDTTDDYRKSRTKIAQSRSAQKGLF